MVHFKDYALTKKGKTKVVKLIKSLRQTNIISKPPSEQVYPELSRWLSEHDKLFDKLLLCLKVLTDRHGDWNHEKNLQTFFLVKPTL